MALKARLVNGCLVEMRSGAIARVPWAVAAVLRRRPWPRGRSARIAHRSIESAAMDRRQSMNSIMPSCPSQLFGVRSRGGLCQEP